MTKREAKKLMTDSNLIDKKSVFFLKTFFSLCIKMDNTTYYQRNRDIALNKAKEYYQNNNKRLKKQAKDKYRNLSEEDKNKKRVYGKNRYHDMPEEKKQELKEYQEAKESRYNNNE